MPNENDLSGRVGLDTTEFKTGVSDLNAQVKSIETSFRASAAVMENWSGSTAGLQGRVDSLSEKLTLQKQKLSTLNEEYQKTVQAQGADSSAAQSLANQMYSTEKSINSTENDLKKYSARLKDVKDKSEGITFKKFNEGLAGTSKAATKALKDITVLVGGATAALGGLMKSSVDNADELQKLSDVTGFTAEQLQVMKYQGSALGVELDTMTGAQSKLIKAMSAAQKGTKDQVKAFRELQVNAVDPATGALRDSNTVFQEVITKLGGVKNETERDALAMTLFGKSAMQLNPLIKAGGEQLSQMADEAKKSGAVMSNEAVAGLDDFGDSVDAMKLSIQGLIGSAFGELTPQLNGLTEKIKGLDLSKLTSGISFALDHLPQIAKAIAGVTGAVVAWKIAAVTANVVSGISNTIMVISTMRASGLAAAQAALKTATGNTAIAQLALNSAWLISPVTLIVAGIVALIAAFVLLWNKCEGFRNFWIGLWNGIKSAAQTVGAWFSGPFVGFFTSAWTGVINFFTGIPAWFAGLWQSITTGITTWLTNMQTGINSTMAAIQDGLTVAWQAIVGVINAILQPFINGILDFWRNMQNGLASIMSGIQNMLSGTWEIIKSVVMGVVLLICDLVTGNFGKLKTDLLGIWNNIRAGAMQVWDGIRQYFSGVLNVIISIFTTAWDHITNNIKTVWTAITTFFAQTWSNIQAGITIAWNGFLTTITTVCTNIRTGIINIWNAIIAWFRALPGTLMTIGANMFTSMKTGVDSTIHTVVDAIKTGIGEAIDWIKDLPSQAFQWGKDIIDSIADGIKSAVKKVKKAVEGVADTIRGYLHFSTPDEGPLVDFGSWMPDFMGGLAAGINANKYKVQNAIRGLATDISIGVNPRVARPAYAGAIAGGAIINYTSNYYSPAAPTPSEVNRINRQNAQRVALITRRR